MYRGNWRHGHTDGSTSPPAAGIGTAYASTEQSPSLRIMSKAFTDEAWDMIIQTVGGLLLLLGIAGFVIAAAS